MTTLFALSGSVRADSHNTALLEHAVDLAAGSGVGARLWTRLKEVPPFDQDDEALPPPVVQDLRRAIAQSAGLLIATPEYSGSVPGQLKNALDWAARPADGHVLSGRTVAVISASPGRYGGVRARRELERILTNAGANVWETGFGLAAAHDAFDSRSLTSQDESDRLRDGLAPFLDDVLAGALGAPSAR